MTCETGTAASCMQISFDAAMSPASRSLPFPTRRLKLPRTAHCNILMYSLSKLPYCSRLLSVCTSQGGVRAEGGRSLGARPARQTCAAPSLRPLLALQHLRRVPGSLNIGQCKGEPGRGGVPLLCSKTCKMRPSPQRGLQGVHHALSRLITSFCDGNRLSVTGETRERVGRGVFARSAPNAI